MSRGAPRPRTRGDCLDGPRPCVYVACKHHLLLSIDETRGRPRKGAPGQAVSIAGERGTVTPRSTPEAVEAWTERAAETLLEMPDTCALDVAERGRQKLVEIGRVLRLTRERVRQIEMKALRHAAHAARAHRETVVELLSVARPGGEASPLAAAQELDGVGRGDGRVISAGIAAWEAGR